MTKKKTNLYDTLGVDKKSDTKTIKRSYRRKAMETHPDRGGDKTEFALVKLAWDVLSDDNKRKKYDETGEYNTDPNNSESKVYGLISHIFIEVMRQLAEKGVDPGTNDLVRIMTDCIHQPLTAINNNFSTLNKQKKFLSKCKGKFKSKASPQLEFVIADQIRVLDLQLEEVAMAKQLHEQALDILKNSTFDHTKLNTTSGTTPTVIRFFASSTSASSW